MWQESDDLVKLKQLRKFVLKSLKESGFAEDKNRVFEMLEQKVCYFFGLSSFTVESGHASKVLLSDILMIKYHLLVSFLQCHADKFKF